MPFLQKIILRGVLVWFHHLKKGFYLNTGISVPSSLESFELLLLFQLRASRIHFRILGRNSGLT
ncbi:hypothetical protein C4Q31_10260 [Leptospira borgpetersenii serovar Ceylonica]|nr:hypothetical protein C4Q31_10260 [Leptospira borgpetersenii serovar Ceylonica]EKQ98509.1 hypothetical protein LEP1GSC121_3023 [Leptospira borgpetersenii serovar Castellonis str. 200801910]KGE24235.1 hypothetical protein IQ66_09115 [Leptospira borgpetersenii serovar Ballum]QHE28443.1 hypothetical protein GS524_05325 [Leptospira borgpetersenii]OOV45588.1 hypothetical protein B1H38_03340 [Leptospira borgpetersenii serovar Ballum]